MNGLFPFRAEGAPCIPLYCETDTNKAHEQRNWRNDDECHDDDDEKDDIVQVA